MEMGCWTSSCHMESPWLSHCLSSGEIRCAPTSGPLAPSLVCSQWPMKARNLGLLASMMGSGNWKASDRSPYVPSPKYHIQKNPLLSPLPSATGTSWPQILPHSRLASPFLQPTFLSLFSSAPTLLLLPSSFSPPSLPSTLLYANPPDAHYLPSSRASATTGYVWCPAPGLGPSPGVPRLYSTPRRVGRTYGSLMGAPVTCVRWSLWHILAWVSRSPWE